MDTNWNGSFVASKTAMALPASWLWRMRCLTKCAPHSNPSILGSNGRYQAGGTQLAITAMGLNQVPSFAHQSVPQGGQRGLRAQAAVAGATDQACHSTR